MNNNSFNFSSNTQQTDLQLQFMQSGINGLHQMDVVVPVLNAGDTTIFLPQWAENTLMIQTDIGSDGTVDTEEEITFGDQVKIYLPLIQR